MPVCSAKKGKKTIVIGKCNPQWSQIRHIQYVVSRDEVRGKHVCSRFVVPVNLWWNLLDQILCHHSALPGLWSLVSWLRRPIVGALCASSLIIKGKLLHWKFFNLIFMCTRHYCFLKLLIDGFSCSLTSQLTGNRKQLTLQNKSYQGTKAVKLVQAVLHGGAQEFIMVLYYSGWGHSEWRRFPAGRNRPMSFWHR